MNMLLISKTVVLVTLFACIPDLAHAREFAADTAGRHVQADTHPHEHNNGRQPGGISLNPGPKVERLALFVDPLPIPTVIDTTNATSLISINTDNGNQTLNNAEWLGIASAVQQGQDPFTITIGAHETYWQFHRDLPPSRVFAFGTSSASASVPGPTIVVASGRTLRVQWLNNITATEHLFPVDTTLAVPRVQGVPMVVHVHGSHSESFSDGHPMAWYTANGTAGPTFVRDTSTYHNLQAPATLWYHDHTMGMTRLNVQAGLFGAYIIRDAAFEDPLSLPSGAYDVPLVFHDKSFMADGSIFVPRRGDNPHIHPHWVPEEFGDFITVNGKVSPFMEVEARKYRFRLVNGCLARFLNISLPLNASYFPSPSLLPFIQVATDSSYLAGPVTHMEYLLAPGVRSSIVIDFSLLPAGSSVTLTNTAPAPYPSGDPCTTFNGQLLQFRVKPMPAGAQDTSAIPPTMLNLPPADIMSAVNYPTGRDIVLSEVSNLLSGEPERSLIDGKHFSEPADIFPHYGDTEIWNIINLTDDSHPVHVHFVPHRVLFRRPFNKEWLEQGRCSLSNPLNDLFEADQSCFMGPLQPARPEEQGWTDTVLAHPGEITLLLLNFTLPADELPFDPSAGPGYVIHCHILNHEDNDMMRPFHVMPSRTTLKQVQGALSVIFP